jgi:hypothetical protein
MLSNGQVSQLCRDLGLSQEAQTIIETIRSSPPSRRVRSIAGNVSVWYPRRRCCANWAGRHDQPGLRNHQAVEA